MHAPHSYEDAYVRATVDADSRVRRLQWESEHLMTPNFRRDGPAWWDRIKHFLQRMKPHRQA